MARMRSKNAGGNFMKQIQEWCGESCDPLAIVCAVVVVVYISLASPANTPAFFGSAAFKALIFAVVAIVVAIDTKIGVIFGLAMVLSVSYSYMRAPTETFKGHEEPMEEGEPHGGEQHGGEQHGAEQHGGEQHGEQNGGEQHEGFGSCGGGSHSHQNEQKVDDEEKDVNATENFNDYAPYHSV